MNYTEISSRIFVYKYLVPQLENQSVAPLEYIMGAGFGIGLGIVGLSKAPLNLITKRKQPRKTS